MTLGVNQKDEPVTVSQQRSQVACRRWCWCVVVETAGGGRQRQVRERVGGRIQVGWDGWMDGWMAGSGGLVCFCLDGNGPGLVRDFCLVVLLCPDWCDGELLTRRQTKKRVHPERLAEETMRWMGLS